MNIPAQRQRIDWIDYGKAICMLCVVLFHTWVYYANNGGNIVRWIEPFYLTTFFFISGYLINTSSFEMKKALISLGKRLVCPYLLFTTLIWMPKALAHGTELDLKVMIVDIGGGTQAGSSLPLSALS